MVRHQGTADRTGRFRSARQSAEQTTGAAKADAIGQRGAPTPGERSEAAEGGSLAPRSYASGGADVRSASSLQLWCRSETARADFVAVAPAG